VCGSRYVPLAPPTHGILPREPNPEPVFQIDEWVKGPYTISAPFVVEVPNGRTVGRHGAVLTPDDFLLRDVSREFFWPPEDHPLLHEEALPPRLTCLKGRWALINGPGNSTYHWLFDTLPRLEVLRLAGYSLDEFDGLLMTRPKYGAHDATLDLLKVPREKIVWCTQRRHFQCDRLVVPSFGNDDLQHHDFVYEFLERLVQPPPVPDAPRRRIFVSRRDAVTARRDLVNEDEIFAMAQRFGFERVTLGDLTFQEQAQCFASAECVISPHGGGLANLCFSRKPMLLVEIFAPDYVPAHFRTLSRQKGFEYEALLGEEVAGPDLGQERLNGGNIRLDPARLESVLCRRLSFGKNSAPTG